MHSATSYLLFAHLEAPAVKLEPGLISWIGSHAWYISRVIEAAYGRELTQDCCSVVIDRPTRALLSLSSGEPNSS